MATPAQPQSADVLTGDTRAPIAQVPVLAGQGHALIHAAVLRHPAPQSAPTALADSVIPIRDSAGRVLDWRLAKIDEPQVRAEYARWHDGFVTEAVIGDVATVGGLLNWARGRVDLSELGILQLPHARVSPGHARRMAWQLQRAADECAKSHDVGLGVMAEGHSGLARGFYCPEDRLTLLSEGDSWVAASLAGLLLHAGQHQDRTHLVSGWHLSEGNVRIQTDEGEVDLGTSQAGKLLIQVALGLKEAIVHEVPLTKVFAGLFVTLADMALLASIGGGQLLIDRAGSLASS
jgi:hypothetical protein